MELAGTTRRRPHPLIVCSQIAERLMPLVVSLRRLVRLEAALPAHSDLIAFEIRAHSPRDRIKCQYPGAPSVPRPCEDLRLQPSRARTAGREFRQKGRTLKARLLFGVEHP